MSDDERAPLPPCTHCGFPLLRHSSLLEQVWASLPVEQWPVHERAWDREASVQIALDPGPEPLFVLPADDGIPF